MPSHISVIPASTSGGKATVRALLAAEEKPTVRAFYRDPSKAPAEFTSNPRFTAVKADVGNGTGIDFTGSDAVFYIPPPPFDGTDVATFAKKSSDAIAKALKEASGVKRLLVHSALGANHDSGIGILNLNHLTDKYLESAAPEVTIVRPCLFYHMWSHGLQSMQQDPPTLVSMYHPADWAVPMVSVNDLGEWSAKTLLDKSSHPSLRIFKFFGPRMVSSNDLKQAMESVTGKEGKMTTIPNEEQQAFWAGQVPEAYVQDFVEYQTCQHPGGAAIQEYKYDETTVTAKTELVDELRQMASQ